MFFDVCPEPIFNYNTKLNCSLGCFAGDIEIELLEEDLPAITTLNGNAYLINPTDTYTVEWETLTFPADCEPTIIDPTKLQSEVSFPCFGTYTFQLTITDSNDNVCVSTCTAIIANGASDPCEGEWPSSEAGLPFTADGTSVADFTDLVDTIQVFGGTDIGWDIASDHAYAYFTGVTGGDFTAEFDAFEQDGNDAFQVGVFMIDNTQQAVYVAATGAPDTDNTNAGLIRSCTGTEGEFTSLADNSVAQVFGSPSHVIINKSGSTVTITVDDVEILNADIGNTNIANLGLFGIGIGASIRVSNLTITAL